MTFINISSSGSSSSPHVYRNDAGARSRNIMIYMYSFSRTVGVMASVIVSIIPAVLVIVNVPALSCSKRNINCKLCCNSHGTRNLQYKQ